MFYNQDDIDAVMASTKHFGERATFGEGAVFGDDAVFGDWAKFGKNCKKLVYMPC